VADFNGDGFLDIAVANRGDNSITLLEGHGDGTFTPYPASPFKLTNTNSVSENAPVAMVSANFRNNIINTANSAPEVDLAVVNEGSNNVTILLSAVDQNGNVTFQEAPQSPIAVGTFPVAIATGDLDGNGVPDLTVVNQTDATVSVLLGSSNLDGTFTPALGSPLATGTTPAGIAIANFANGTVPDIAVTNTGSSTLSVFVGVGQGLFASPLELNINGASSPGALIAAALTSTGLPDVALVAQGASASQGIVVVIQDTTNFSNTITNGTAQTPYPGSEYVDLGVKIKATPTLHNNNEVTLQLEFEIRALAGSSVNGIPVISNRTLSQTVRVKEDEPTLIAGLTDREETRLITGLPGFAEIPGAKYAFSTKNNSLQDTELLIVITPRKLRLVDHFTKTIYAGHGDNGSRGSAFPRFRETPIPPQPQPQPQP
jgi:Bacterial type II and III secretion system protein/FG-GAP-like repeat